MKKHISRIAIAAAVLGCSTASFAECSSDVCTGITITGIYTYGASSPGFAWITTSGTEALLTTCTPDSGIFIRVDGQEAKSDWLYSQLLTAFQTNQRLDLRVTGGGGVCRLEHVFVQK